MVLDVGLALLPAHIEQRVKLEDAAALFEDVEGGPAIALPTHQTADPNLVFFFELFQRLDFVDGTAIIRILGPRLIRGGKLVLPVLGLDFAYLEIVDLREVVLVHQRFLKMIARVDEEHLLFGLINREQME